MSTDNQPVLLELRDGIAIVTLNRPDKLNSLTPEMLLDLPRKLKQAVREGARVIVLTGAGRAFCSGAALGDESGQELDGDLGDRIETYYNPLAKTLSDIGVPVIAAVNGPAAGAGASIALSADVIIAARSAYFLLAFVNIGLVPDTGATWMIARAAGRVKAMEMALLGEKMSADTAYEAGLITRVVDDQDLMPAVVQATEALASKPAHALRMIRKQMKSALELSFEQSLLIERDHQRIAGFTEDFAEGRRAFQEKRKPNFKGQ